MMTTWISAADAAKNSSTPSMSVAAAARRELGPLGCSYGVQPIALYPILPKMITFQLDFKCIFAPWNAKSDEVLRIHFRSPKGIYDPKITAFTSSS